MKKFDPSACMITKVFVCGVPLRLDAYRNCSFQCRYCFANNRADTHGGHVDDNSFEVADSAKLEKYFDKVLVQNKLKATQDYLVKEGVTIHVGGMSDPFQPINEKYKATNELIDVCNKYERSLLFSTKSNQVHGANIRPDLHAFQLSVTNLANRKDIEPNVPDIDTRLKFYKELKQEGFKVGIRMQPFIPDVTSLEIVKAFEGCDHFILECLKLDPTNRAELDFAFNELNINPDAMISKGGRLYLNPATRMDLYAPFIEYFKQHGISYSVADNDLRENSTDMCCCGDALIKKSTQLDPTALIKKYGRQWQRSDVQRRLEELGIAECEHMVLLHHAGVKPDTESQCLKKTFNTPAAVASPSYQWYRPANQFFHVDTSSFATKKK